MLYGPSIANGRLQSKHGGLACLVRVIRTISGNSACPVLRRQPTCERACLRFNTVRSLHEKPSSVRCSAQSIGRCGDRRINFLAVRCGGLRPFTTAWTISGASEESRNTE